MVLVSQGVPFIHAGQEFFRTKQGVENSYKSPDSINKIDWNLADKNWKIYSRSPVAPPHYIGANAKVENSMITEGCEIEGEIDFSVLFANVTVEEGAEVKYSIVMPGAKIEKGAKVQYAMIAENAVVKFLAQDSDTVIDKVEASDWLGILATNPNGRIIKVIVEEGTFDANKKIKTLKVREIYKQQ